MNESLSRLLGSFARLLRWPGPPDARASRDESTDGRGSDPLAKARLAVQNTLPLVEDQLAAMRIIEQSLSGIDEAVGKAWRDRENLTTNYYALLRGMLEILDDCRALDDNGRGFEVVVSGCERILCEQGVEVIPAAEGQRFEPGTQCCEETRASSEHAPGTVLRVVQSGYRRQLPNGSSVIVRPARVVVSQPPANPEEPLR